MKTRASRKPVHSSPAPCSAIRTPISPRPPELQGLDRLGWLAAPSWAPWRTALRALLADPLTPEDGPEALALFQACTGRSTWPTRRSKDAWFACGRRSGKSLGMAKLAVAIACFTDVRPFLAPGEQAAVMLLAADRHQAGVLYRYVLGLLESEPALRQLIVGEPAQERTALSNGVVIEVHTSSFRAVRGFTVLACVCDEVSFWDRQVSANPDAEVLAAVGPGLSTIPFSLQLVISSVHARKGALYDTLAQHWGREPDSAAPEPTPFVWKASTRTMNPEFRESIIAAAMARDPAKARAEYLSEFRSDLESYVSREVLQACIDTGVSERPQYPSIEYVCFVDPSGSGSEVADRFSWSIAHAEVNEDGSVLSVIDCADEVGPPFSPDAVVARIAEDLKRYGVGVVIGDKYAGSWPSDRFAAYGIGYLPADMTKSDIYRQLLPLLSDQRARLLDIPRLREQFLGLERSVSKGGRDIVDHPRGTHDDLANAVAGAALLAQDLAHGTPAPTPEEEALMEQQERDLARALGWAPAPPGGWDNYVADDDAGWRRDPHEGMVDIGRS